MKVTENGTDLANRVNCTTPFTTGKLDITRDQRASLFCIDMLILLFNMIANLSAIYALDKLQQIKRKPSMNLLFALCVSDCCFSIFAQILFAIKIFNPELPCIYDLTFEFLSTVLADLSLCLVVLIAISRYIHTRHMIRVKVIITAERVRLSILASFIVATIASSVTVFSNTYGDADLYLQTEIMHTFVGVVLILLVVIIYRKTEDIARRRKAGLAGNSDFHYTCYSQRVLRKIMISTLLTLLPLRIPFFASTVYKAVKSEKQGIRLSWWMQYTHLGCYAIYCLSAGANAVIFLYNNKTARLSIKQKLDVFLSSTLLIRQGSIVEPTPATQSVPPLVQPVVTTGWYDRYVPTEAPTTLSTAVVGKKVWRNKRQLPKPQRRRKKKSRHTKTTVKSDKGGSTLQLKHLREQFPSYATPSPHGQLPVEKLPTTKISAIVHWDKRVVESDTE